MPEPVDISNSQLSKEIAPKNSFQVKTRKYGLNIAVATYSIMLLVWLSWWFMAYISHKPAYEQLKYIGLALVCAGAIAHSLEGLIKPKGKSSYILEIIIVALYSLSFLLLLLATIVEQYPSVIQLIF